MAALETEDRLAPGWVYQPMGLADLARGVAERLGRNEMVPYTQFCRTGTTTPKTAAANKSWKKTSAASAARLTSLR